MLKSPTVLVLGAGASVPYGFPAGWPLMRQISSVLRDHAPDVAKGTMRHLLDCGYEAKFLRDFGDALNRSGRLSIDGFLESRPDFLDVGKHAIAAALIPHEREESLFSDDDAGGWLRYLAQFILRTRAEFERVQLTIVTFNYDRSFEYFLYRALRHSYRLSEAQAAEMLSHVEVIHVHGSLGEPEWRGGEDVRPYTTSVTDLTIRTAARKIRIIHEADPNQGEDFTRARARLKSASRILFLGFGYHQTNVERLDLPVLSERLPHLSGASFGLQAGEVQSAKSLFNGRIELAPNHLKCREFLQSLPIQLW